MPQRIETITTKQILSLIEKQNYRCALTGWQLTPETASIDHIVPLSKGGDHAVENAQIIDWRVNQAKGTLSNEEFYELCCAVAASPMPTRSTAENEALVSIPRAPRPARVYSPEQIERLQRQLDGVERKLAANHDEHLEKQASGLRQTLADAAVTGPR
jgi:hypothetical protein